MTLRALSNAGALALALQACGAPPEADVTAESTDDEARIRRPDAGTSDAGAGAGPSLADWYATYNHGMGTAYLAVPFTTSEAGDPRYRASRHRYHREVHYGPHTRNVLDFWQVASPTRTPVAVFIHGGGFNNGSRDDVHAGTDVARLLAAGISVATISYRWGYEDSELAVLATNPDDEGSVHDENGTRVDFILRDCARAIQFIRYRAAQLGVDTTRIGVWGPSAGGGCSTWIGTTDDLAVRGHADPVLRQSSRVAAVGHLVGQATYDWTRWPELLRMSDTFIRDQVGFEQARLSWHWYDDLKRAADLRAVLDYYEHMGPGDAAFYTENMMMDVSPAMVRSNSQVIHHPRGHVALYQRCVAMGLDCEIATRTLSSGFAGDVVDFMIDRLR